MSSVRITDADIGGLCFQIEIRMPEWLDSIFLFFFSSHLPEYKVVDSQLESRTLKIVNYEPIPDPPRPQQLAKK